ncbi:1457_t:CDS:2 [Ambispora gerdemannii]|uniref:tRNA ligase n=1 Tax=Ambispora gerdemannii TaxID=144530 RepID=A0A9N9ANG6_9GLOM|nr:1457_t:CDS:2 [Ambispora gerdemannii]
MSDVDFPTYIPGPQERQKTHELVKNLQAMSEQKITRNKYMRRGKPAKRTDYVTPISGTVISSWKMNEWDYKKGLVPTMARGLFTRKDNNQYEIVIRGYNKFFNIGEMESTKWENIYRNTEGPYEVTIKENGCIIFISGLPKGEIIVTSKHSHGARTDVPVSHAQKGEQWLERHLENVGKTKEDLANYLYEHNLTAIAELCDDNFEEHVLPYPLDKSGLYLHGVNYNTIDLQTWSSNKVTAFAKYWGFITTKYYIKETAEEVKRFTDDVKEQRLLDGRPIEGFVVRCKREHQDFFFKIKYDEPYLMYREWRELTKAILANKKPRSTYTLSRYYADWVKEKLKTDPELFKDYSKGLGIIKVRDMFLEEWTSRGDSEKSPKEEIPKIPKEERRMFKKTLLVPVATIGCGKTAVSLILGKLFNFGHIQNDDMVGKKARYKFHEAIKSKFESHDVVIADRNNHLTELRKTLIEAVKTVYPNIQVVALYWNHSEHNLNEVFEATSKRVISRGKAHQSLTPENPSFEHIIWKFLKDFQPLDSNNGVDDQFDVVIDLDPLNDIQSTLDTIFNELSSILGIEIPDEHYVEKAINYALEYQPTVKKNVILQEKRKTANRKSSSKKSQKFAEDSSAARRKKPPLYYGIAVELDVKDYLKNLPELDNNTLFETLQRNQRIRREHHVTLIHATELRKSGSQEFQELWEEYRNMVDNDYKTYKVELYIDKIIYNSQLMALVVREIDPPEITSINKIPHITVGTVSDKVKAAEANRMLESALLGVNGKGKGQSDIQIIQLEKDLHVCGTIREFY